MKRKIALLIVMILSFSLFVIACGQGDITDKKGEIDETKAKELALDNINKAFQTNLTEATV